jgi:cytochrome c556
MKSVIKLVTTAVLLLSTCGLVMAADEPANKQAAAANAGPSPAKQAIAVRKAAFTLIANNFKPIGEVLQGKAPYHQAEINKRAQRVAFLSELLHGTFPDDSNLGTPDTKATADVWKKKAEFEKQLKDFETHAKALAKVTATETTASDAFKAAAKAVAESCKGCHDGFKAK